MNKYFDDEFKALDVNKRFAAISGCQEFDIQEAINAAEDKDAMVNKLVWMIPAGKFVADNETVKALVEEIKAMA